MRLHNTNYSPVVFETDVQLQTLGSATHSPPNGHEELHTTAAYTYITYIYL